MKESDFKDLLILVENYAQSNNFLIIDETQSWISQLIEEIEEVKPSPLTVRSKLKEAADYFYAEDVKIFKSRATSNARVREIVSSHGTAQDIITALASYCVDGSGHSLYELRRLVNFLNPKRKQKSVKLIEYLVTLFRDTYLPGGYVAKEFECHSFSSLLPYVNQSPETVVKQLVLWYFEDQLRVCYLQLIENLSLLSNQEVKSIQTMAIAKLSKFLCSHPKQDAEICLQKIINKLGDNAGKVAGVTIDQLRMLQQNCPQLRPLIVSLIHTFLYRKGCTERTQFYGLCVLTELSLSKNDPLANRLIEIYFQFFTASINKGTVDNRFMSCLMRGINKAFTESRYEQLEKKLDTMYIMCHLVSFNRATQVAQLIYQTFKDNLSERYFNLVYKMILNPNDFKSTAISSFLNLVYKSMKKDTEMERIQAFFKRMLQVSAFLPPTHVCAILKVISQVLEENINTTPIRQSLIGKGKYNKKNKNKNKMKGQDKEKYKRETYDNRCQNPLYSRAELSHLYELLRLQQAYHPSVRIFTKQLFDKAAIDYSGDPFVDFSNKKFVDRFVQKNQKKMTYEGNDMYVSNKQYIPEGARNLPVDSKAYRQTAEKDIPPEEVFFYKFYKNQKLKRVENKKINDDIDDELEMDAVCDYEVKKMNWKAYLDQTTDDFPTGDVFSKETYSGKGSKKENKFNKEADEDSDDAFDEEICDLEDEEELFEEDDEESEEDEEDYTDSKKKSKPKGEKRQKEICKRIVEGAEEFSAMLDSNLTNNGFKSNENNNRNFGKRKNRERNSKRKLSASTSNKRNKKTKKN